MNDIRVTTPSFAEMLSHTPSIHETMAKLMNVLQRTIKHVSVCFRHRRLNELAGLQVYEQPCTVQDSIKILITALLRY